MVEVHRFDILVDIGVLHTLQRPFDQHLQFVEITAELQLQLFVFEQFDPQPQARDGRAQVMGNGAEQLATLGQIATDALAHGIEGAADFHHLAAATLQHRRHLLRAQRHIPGRAGQALERATLPVHQQTDEQQ